jgi:hypothetical protein
MEMFDYAVCPDLRFLPQRIIYAALFLVCSWIGRRKQLLYFLEVTFSTDKNVN